MKKTLVPVTALVLAMASATWGAMQALTLPQDVEDFKHIGSLVIPDKASPLFGIHHFYLNDKGMPAFKKSEPYAEGAIFVGKVYEADEEEGALNEGKMRFYTYMEKNREGADTGGWQFAAFSPDGKLLEKDVKKECFGCHASQKDSDYVFSKPVK
ncbi:MAG: cytochrome P460 family protein [Nitrospiraceae bacterium]